MSLKQKILSGILWQGLERIGQQSISFLVAIILARLLLPEQFGVIAIMLVFTAICGVFVDSGFGTALVQRKDLHDDDCNSVFFINLAIATAFYGLIFAIAPWAERFYGVDHLAVYLRVLALKLPINAVARVHLSLLSRRMLFKQSFRIQLAATALAGITGIVLAYRGFGVWALIAQQLVLAGVSSVLLWVMVKWVPHLRFEWQRTWELFSFGWKMLVSVLLDTGFHEVYHLVVGKLFNVKMLSYYHRGQSIPALGMGVLSSSLTQVFLPAFSSIQNDRERIREVARRALRGIMFFAVPVLAMMIVFARPFVSLVLTDKWLPCVLYIQLGALIYFFWPFHVLNLQIITACGRSDLFLLLEIIKKAMVVLIVIVTWRYGLPVMVCGSVFAGFLSMLGNALPNTWLVKYPPWRQLADVAPYVLMALVAAFPSCLVVKYVANNFLCLLAGGVTFTVVYVTGVWGIGSLPITPAQLKEKLSRK